MHGRRKDISRRHVLEQRALAALSSSVVCVSDFLRQQIIDDLRLNERRVTTIKNGISLTVRRPSDSERQRARARLGLSPDDVVVGNVGELSTVKNLDLALEAAALAVPAVPNLKVVFIGDGNERRHLEGKAVNLGLEDRVVFAGWRRDVEAILPALDVYACSSHYEGISLSILEAMALGRALVATAVGGNPELIADGITGLLVPPGDASALAERIALLARQPELRAVLGVNAQTHVQNTYGLSRMIEGYSGIYKDLLSTR